MNTEKSNRQKSGSYGARLFIGEKIGILGILIVSISCAAHTESLKKAQSDFTKTSANSEVMENSAAHMQRAQKNLDLATKQSDEDLQKHYSFLTSKHVEIATVESSRKVAEKELKAQRNSRGEALLDARTQEADDAVANAQMARERTEEAESQMEIFRQDTIAAQTTASEAVSDIEAMKKTLKEMQTKETSRGLEVTLEGSFFDTQESNLKPGAMQKLNSIARALRENPSQQALIEGHTDNSGSSVFNQTLSQQRADSVANYLESQGIKSDRLMARGYGEDYPSVTNSTPTGRQQNRRVDIVFLNKETAKNSTGN